METDARILERGLERLEKIGWVQGDFISTENCAYEEEDGGVIGFCMAGALSTRNEIKNRTIVGISSKPWRKRAIRRLTAAIRESTEHERGFVWGPGVSHDQRMVDFITSYNDQTGRTKEEVVAVYRRAIVMAHREAALKEAKKGASEADLATAGD